MEPLNWMTSSYSLKDWDWRCVRAATLPDDGGIAVGDSKDPDGPILRVPRVNAMLFIHAADGLRP